MSIMGDLADEALKPVKTGVYIGTAVLTVGGLAIAANSQPGRKFLGGVVDAVKGVPSNSKNATKNKQIEDKNANKSGHVQPDDDDVNMINNDNSQQENNDEQYSNVKGANNV